jgi:hypothetical protein
MKTLLSRVGWTTILLVIILLLGSITQNAEAVAPVNLDGVDTSLGDAEIYAKDQGISNEEAAWRFHLQEVAGHLDAKLSKNEAETFAGLWVEHSPKFQIVVLFTQGPEQTIKPHITDEIAAVLDVRTAKVSLAELENAQQQLLSSVTDLGIRVETEINVYENNIQLAVVQADKTKFDLAVQNGLLILPDYIKVIM